MTRRTSATVVHDQHGRRLRRHVRRCGAMTMRNRPSARRRARCGRARRRHPRPRCGSAPRRAPRGRPRRCGPPCSRRWTRRAPNMCAPPTSFATGRRPSPPCRRISRTSSGHRGGGELGRPAPVRATAMSCGRRMCAMAPRRGGGVVRAGWRRRSRGPVVVSTASSAGDGELRHVDVDFAGRCGRVDGVALARHARRLHRARDCCAPSGCPARARASAPSRRPRRRARAGESGCCRS